MKRKRIIIVILIGIVVSGIVLMYSSYALFSANQISKSAITIKAGTMNGTLKVDGATTSKLTLAKGAKQTFVVTLENLNSIEGKFIPYYSGTIPDGVTFGYMEATGIDLPIETTLSKNGKKTYSIYLENNSTSSVTITLGVQGGLSNQPLSLPTNFYLIPQAVKKNTNISNIWKYDQVSGSSTFCVTGEESTCLPINPETFEIGTIIKYKVNDTTAKYFHVISDDGDTLTLQQRENTVYAIPWYSNADDNTKGPTTILPVLEAATNGWTNVLDQTYTMGSTVFKDNAYTGCNYANGVFKCATNQYTLGERTAKARMITAQEVISLGCTNASGSCPIWMYNYLSKSVSYGGTVNQTEENKNNNGYWTMTAQLPSTANIYIVQQNGNLGGTIYPTTTYFGGRAVVQIEKSKVMKPTNENITHVYKYDQTNTATKCITGEESTCVELSEKPEIYENGTIVRYKVNDSLEKYFYVISDNEDTLTLQQRENTVYDIAWYTGSDNTNGPTIILPALENATKDWTNVLDQTYILGTTVFKDNAYTGCNISNICTANKYPLLERNAKSRLISIQEAGALGCKKSNQTCPVWMYNYLKNSTNYGGTVNQTGDIYGNNYGYWTMNAYLDSNSSAWGIGFAGRSSEFYTGYTLLGGRAVIMIKK